MTPDENPETDDQLGQGQPDQAEKPDESDLEKVQEDAAERREEEGGYQ